MWMNSLTSFNLFFHCKRRAKITKLLQKVVKSVSHPSGISKNAAVLTNRATGLNFVKDFQNVLHTTRFGTIP